jgi:hypothetical protein
LYGSSDRKTGTVVALLTGINAYLGLGEEAAEQKVVEGGVGLLRNAGSDEEGCEAGIDAGLHGRKVDAAFEKPTCRNLVGGYIFVFGPVRPRGVNEGIVDNGKKTGAGNG